MYPTLSRGDSGPDVELLQRALRDLGYDVEVDGDFDERTENALYQYQTDHELRPVESRFCGPDTWASIAGQFGNLEGLRSGASVDGYVGDAYGIWNSCRSPEDRIAALETEVNQELAHAGVPYVQFILDPAQGPHATFDFRTWIAHIDPTSFQNEAAERLSSAEQAEISGAIYHEARHAEQWYEIARLLAGLEGLDAATIHSRTEIREDVCVLAAANPILQCTISNGPAFEWYESVYGSGREQRNATLNSLHGSHEHWGDYRTDLAEESDAWDTGGTVQREWHRYETGGTTVQLPTLLPGDTSEDVRYLQQLLQWRGYYSGTPSGTFDAATVSAVQGFRVASGIAAGDTVDQPVWEALIP